MKKVFFVFIMLFLAVNSYGQVAQYLYDSAMDKYEKKDYSGAVSELTKAIELENPNYVLIGNWYSMRGGLKAVLGDYRGALEDYEKAVRLIPENYLESLALAYGGRGNMKMQLERNKDAIKDFNKAIKLSPKDGSNYGMRGLVKTKINSKKESGCLDFSKAGELGFKEAFEYIKTFCN